MSHNISSTLCDAFYRPSQGASLTYKCSMKMNKGTCTLWITRGETGWGCLCYNCYNMDTLRISKVTRVGNSLGIVIPVEIIRGLNIKRGDQVVFGVYNGNNIVIKRLTTDDVRKLKPSDISM